MIKVIRQTLIGSWIFTSFMVKAAEAPVNIARLLQKAALEENYSLEEWRQTIDRLRPFEEDIVDSKSMPDLTSMPNVISLQGQVKVRPVAESYVNCSVYSWMQKRLKQLNDQALVYAEQIYEIASEEQIRQDLDSYRFDEISHALKSIDEEFSALANEVYFDPDREVSIIWNIQEAVDFASEKYNLPIWNMNFEWSDQEFSSSVFGYWHEDMKMSVRNAIPSFNARYVSSAHGPDGELGFVRLQSDYGYVKGNHYPTGLTLKFNLSAHDYCLAKDSRIDFRVNLKFLSGLYKKEKVYPGSNKGKGGVYPPPGGSGNPIVGDPEQPKVFPKPSKPVFGQDLPVCPYRCTPMPESGMEVGVPKKNAEQLESLSDPSWRFGSDIIFPENSVLIHQQEIVFSAVIGGQGR